MLYSHAGFPPATASFTATRISASEGPGIAAFGAFAAPLSFRGVLLDDTGGIAVDSSSIELDGAPLCGSSSSPSATSCVRLANAPTRSVAVADCTPGTSELDCMTVCVEVVTAPGTVPSSPVVGEGLREPRIAPAVSDAKGCLSLGGLEPERAYQLAFLSDALVPSQGSIRVVSATPAALPRARIDLEEYTYLGGAPTTSPPVGFGPDGFDLATGVNWVVYTCKGPVPPASKNVPSTLPAACKTGMQGWGTPKVVGAAPGALGPFPSTESFLPSGLTMPRPSPLGGLWYGFGLAPGDYELELAPPSGATARCTPYFAFDSIQNGIPFGADDASNSWTNLELRVEAGYASSAAYLYCTDGAGDAGGAPQ